MYYVYMIANDVNEKLYIGKTGNLEKRWGQHKATSRRESSPQYNFPLYKDMREFGVEHFWMEPIKELEFGDEALYWENYYINHFDAYENGYNNEVSIEGKTKRKCKRKSATTKKKGALVKVKETGELFTAKELSKILGVSEDRVREAIRKHREIKGFHFGWK